METGVIDCPMPVPFREKIGITLFLAWLFYLGFVTRIIFAPLMPAIERDLGIGHSEAGTLFLMMSIGFLLAPFCSGVISSKINHRGNLTISAWFVGFCLIPFAFVDAFWVLRVLPVIIGLSAGVHLPSAIATITAEIQKKDWGKALSVHQAAPPLAFVTAPLIASLLLNWISWRFVLIAWAALALFSAVVFSFRGTGGDFPGQLPNSMNIRELFSKFSFWIMVLLFAMAMGGNAGIYAMLSLFLVNEHGMDLTSANTILGLSQLPSFVMVFIAGWITDRVGQKTAMMVTLLIAGGATILISILKGGWLVTLIFIQPAMLSSFFPAAFGAISRIAPPSLRSVTSAIGPPISFLIGGGILPALIGYMGEHYTFSAGIMIAGVFMLMGPVLIFFLRMGQYDNQAGC